MKKKWIAILGVGIIVSISILYKRNDRFNWPYDVQPFVSCKKYSDIEILMKDAQLLKMVDLRDVKGFVVLSDEGDLSYNQIIYRMNDKNNVISMDLRHVNKSISALSQSKTIIISNSDVE